MKKYKILLVLLFTCSISLWANGNNDVTKYKLIVFEGSDWCKYCKQLDANILSDATFKNDIKSLSLTVEKIDFPRRKKQTKQEIDYNKSIAEKYNFNGRYPTLILVNTATQSYKKIAYKNSSIESLLASIRKHLVNL